MPKSSPICPGVLSALCGAERTHAMLNQLIIFAAKYLFLLLPAIAFMWFVQLPPAAKKEVLVLGVITGVLALALGRFAALFFFDPRPFVAGHFTPLIPHAPDNGFPSDHTLLSSAIAITVFLRNRRIGVLLWFLVLLVGAGRIGSGLHSPVDVGGSIAFSIIAGLIADFIVHRAFAGSARSALPSRRSNG